MYSLTVLVVLLVIIGIVGIAAWFLFPNLGIPISIVTIALALIFIVIYLINFSIEIFNGFVSIFLFFWTILLYIYYFFVWLWNLSGLQLYLHYEDIIIYIHNSIQLVLQYLQLPFSVYTFYIFIIIIIIYIIIFITLFRLNRMDIFGWVIVFTFGPLIVLLLFISAITIIYYILWIIYYISYLIYYSFYVTFVQFTFGMKSQLTPYRHLLTQLSLYLYTGNMFHISALRAQYYHQNRGWPFVHSLIWYVPCISCIWLYGMYRYTTVIIQPLVTIAAGLKIASDLSNYITIVRAGQRPAHPLIIFLVNIPVNLYIVIQFRNYLTYY